MYNSVAHDKRISWPNLLHAPMQREKKEASAGGRARLLIVCHVTRFDGRRPREESQAKIETPFLIKEITRALRMKGERRAGVGRERALLEFAFNSAKRVENFHFLSF
jgi:hypothetical protein